MAGALVALALWPVLEAGRAPAATMTPAPLTRDYESRDQIIAFYERELRRQPADQIKMRMLAGMYLQRFREQYDLSDVSRAERLAQRSIELQPQGNTPGQMALAAALLTYHDFRGALVHERDAWEGEPSNSDALAQIASLQMELGEYRAARATLARIPPAPAENPSVDAIRARYDELTGKLARARALIGTAAQTVDSDVDSPAYDRSWYHMRAAQLAWEAGDDAQAQTEFDRSLADYPNNAMALMFEAKMYRSQGRWNETLAAASACANLYPLPQALGYEADADRALGRARQAREIDELIDAEQRLFNAQGINDRLLANYYAQRGRDLGVALRAARSDLQKRGNEIYADDTLAWVLAALGRWPQARVYAERAVRYGTQDAELQYHAAVIALHTGYPREARRRLQTALADNPDFDPFESPNARRLLASLQ